MMKIPLTQGKFTIVGPRDYAFLIQWRWYYDGCYAIRNNHTSSKTIRMHRVILERMGFKDFAKSDHVNRNKLDNHRRNLRPATSVQSSYNRSRQNNNTSGYTGVWWDKRKKKWFTRIGVNRKRIFLGYYNDSKEAARVYNKAAIKYHGEFAVLNEV